MNKILDTCILNCLTYGCQIWIFNKFTENRINAESKEIRKNTNVLDALKYSK